jgi:hypothetical protein
LRGLARVFGKPALLATIILECGINLLQESLDTGL